MLGWQDVKQAYRRSAIGPFWITGGMAVQIAAMGLVFAVIFKTPLQDYLPFLATSIIIWGYMTGVINDGCLSFINAEGIIKQLRLPLYVYIVRTVWKQLITLGHNIAIIPFVFLAVMHGYSWSLLLFVPGAILVTANLTWMAFVLAVLSARFRDIPQVVGTIFTILYFISPVMWEPSLIPPGTAHIMLGLNPMYHLLQVVRLPILGEFPTVENWAICLVLVIVGWSAVAVVLKKYKNQIAFWV